MEQAAKKKGGWKRFRRIVLKTFMWIFLLILTLFLLILTPPVQNFICKKVTNYLEKKLDTEVKIKRLYITLTGKIALDDIYIADKQKDTLLSAGELRVNMSLYKLIFKNEIDIKSIRLDEATAKIKRELPDTTFNFQFIADAFSSGDKDTSQTTEPSKGTAIGIGSIEFNTLRLVYKDVVTGNDITAGLKHFDTKIEKFDLDKLNIGIGKVNIDGLLSTIILSKPIEMPLLPADTLQNVKAAVATPSLLITIKGVDIKKSLINYRDSVGLSYATLDIGNLAMKDQSVDAGKGIYHLGDILLADTKASMRVDKRSAAAIKVTTTTGETATDTTQQGIQLFCSSLAVKNTEIKYDDDNSVRQKQGMDYAHLGAAIENIEINKFVFANDSIAGSIKNAVFKEQSGFVLQSLQTDFLYAARQAYLKDLYLQTPGTKLKRDIAIRYASVESMAADIANLQITADIAESKIAVKDILTFVPSLQQQPAFADANAVWHIDGKIAGRVGDLSIEKLKIAGLANTKVDVSGRITGLPDADKLVADLDIKQLSSSRNDILAFMPKNTLPESIALPGTMQLSGKIKGGTTKLNTDMLLTTDWGSASINGSLQNISDANKALYDATIETRSFDLGSLLKDKETYGPVSATFTAKGKGYDMKTADAVVKGTVHAAVYKKYNYKDLVVNMAIASQQLKADAAIKDANIDLALSASADLSKEYPSFMLTGNIDSIKLKELNLTQDVLVYRGKINADFPVADPDSLIGKLFVTQSLLVTDKQRIQADTIQLLSGFTAEKKFLQFDSDVAHARLEGTYTLTQLPDVLMQAIEPYYAINTGSTKKVITHPYDFTLNASVIDKPLLHQFVPALEKADGILVQSHFATGKNLEATVTAKEIAVSGTQLKGLQLTANGADSALLIKARMQRISSGTSIVIDSTILTASLANNIVDFDVDIKDKNAKDKYSIAGKLQQLPQGDLAFSLNPDGLLLNYEKWKVAADNKILITQGGINASHFTLDNNGQQLSLASLTTAGNAPLNIKFNDFRLATITAIALADSSLIDGRLTGEVTVKDMNTNMVFFGDLGIKDLSYHNDTVGNVMAKVSNSTSNVYNADVTLSGRGNDAVVKGTYNAGSGMFDLDMDLKQLPLKTAEAFAGGSLKNTTGFVNGNFKIKGTPAKPSVNGDLNFNKAGLNVAMLNSYFTIDNEKLQFTDKGIVFNKFEVKDSTGNALTIDGDMATSNFMNYRFDMTVRANNFKALSSTKKDNKLFYGQLFFNTNLTIKGTEISPVIDGRLTVNDKTKMTVVLPQSDPGVVEREGVIEFVDMDAPVTDSLFMLAYDSMNTSSITGMDVALNIEIDKGADFTLIIDEGNGDFLNVKGDAQLTAGIDPSGKITLVGTYELEQGAYELSFNMIRKKFDIQKGSKIIWEGEPTDANVDITAKYTANTAPLDLVKGQLDENITTQARNTYLQKLPFDVNLKMEGELLKPQISFDIILPENKNYGVSNDILTNVRTKLEQLRQSTGDMNKQVFSLLLLNRFVAENPFSSSTSISSNILIRQSVTKLLTEQLNRLADGLIQGVDINLGVESSDDYTTGERKDKTDLNVGLSKRLLNDRLTVTVGSNFALEGPQNSNQQSNNIAGNVAIDYTLSSDGRYKLRAYRKNDYQGVIDGYVVETGVGFIITLDYNNFKQLFQSKKKQEQLRKERREKRLKEEEEENKKKAAATQPPVEATKKEEQ